MCFMIGRIVSIGGWLHSIDERDVGTEFRFAESKLRIPFPQTYKISLPKTSSSGPTRCIPIHLVFHAVRPRDGLQRPDG